VTSIEILGCRVDAVSPADAVERIARLALAPTPSIVVTLGVEMVMEARRNGRFRTLVNSAALSLCDTVGILLASRLRGGPLRDRVTGIDLIGPLAERSARTGELRIYLFGAAPQVAERAAAVIASDHPGVRVVGTRNGYFAPGESAAIAHAIARSGANVVLIGLGSPKQEFWLEEYLAATGAGVGIGVGGSFDVLAGATVRAPRLMRRAGLEWLYRLLREPGRWRRQLALPHFALEAAREAFWARGNKERQR
jgi:N-acetylglucosaminyldiphosphoundecaprenol N-acetyl-beta-D-mannosaminyltransferase